MNAVRQKCRPKHQILILKCYPRLPKNSSADVKPNSSELSYLLFYASTRRSKLHKVGAFLERKTASDVYKWRSANVQVTLEILTALLENKVVGTGSGFALIAPYVLRIVREILQNTNDISLVEASLSTWDTFCTHQDQATLAADHEYRELFEQVVQLYAAFAAKNGDKRLGGKNAATVSVPNAIRLREAGLGAMKSVLASDALSSESGRQLDMALPVVLSNLKAESGSSFDHLTRAHQRNEEQGKERPVINARQSMATVRTATTTGDLPTETDPRTAEGTAQEADMLAEEHVACLALDSLRLIFTTENRAQVMPATSSVLSFFQSHQHRPAVRASEKPSQPDRDSSWEVKIFEIMMTWTPVQNRFILLVAVVETLVRLPLDDSNLRQQLLLADIVGNTLRSDLNMIGLSVMDVLLGLMQQILRALQLGGPQASGRRNSAHVPSSPNNGANEKPAQDITAAPPSDQRVLLVERLKACIADLATHVYYTDQINDMISALLLRLKPSASTNAQSQAVTAAAIQEPETAVHEVASNVSQTARERSQSQSDGFFSFETAQQAALEVVRDIFLVAKSKQSRNTEGLLETRNNVPIEIWEGTQWLLRDPSLAVRRSYVEALCTWLALETKKADWRIKEPKTKTKANGALARRAVSNASARGQSRRGTSNFLQLLHLAVYENALQFAETSEADILLLHLLQSTLNQKLGVNAVQSSLPMMFALQEEIAQTDSPLAKIRIGSLVHGYLWSLGEVFDFDYTPAGRDVQAEIARRREHGLWVDALTVPAMPVQTIHDTTSKPSNKVSPDMIAQEALRPFDKRHALIDCIAESYSSSVASPPASAPGSPRQVSAQPTIDRSTSGYLSAKPAASTELSETAKEHMHEVWTKEDCLATIAAAVPKTASVTGSRSSPTHALMAGNHRQLLAAANSGLASRSGSNHATPGTQSPAAGESQQQLASKYGSLTTSHRQQAFGLYANNGRRLHSQSPENRQRRPSGSTNGKGSSSAGGRGTLRVDELKRVLADGGHGAVPLTAGSMARHDGEDTASESMMDFEGEGVDFGSEDDYGTSENNNNTKRAEGSAEPTQLPTLDRGSDRFAGGMFTTEKSRGDKGDTSARVEGYDKRPATAYQGGSVRSKRTASGRRNITELLAGLGEDERDGGVEEPRRPTTSIGRPPY
ncbi:hypothetical protein MBLNU230_g0224t1 [Neophaeotheca triangularis]